jgi:hypothetical protein
LFQALDADGLAYRTMRTVTYLQPGERRACVGCHERRNETAYATAARASRRPAARLRRSPLDGEPFSYVRVVQPVLDRHCVRCHSGPAPAGGMDLTGAPLGSFSRSYLSLCGAPAPPGDPSVLVPRFPARNQIQVTPAGGAIGARGSRLVRLLRNGHGGTLVGAEDLRRIGVWLDCNAIFYGVTEPEGQAAQRRGEVAYPTIE